MFSLTQIIIGLSCILGYVLAFEGEITYYTPGLGSCGETDTEADKVVAMSPAQFSTVPDLCGKTITIEMDGKNTTAKVVDKCPSCDANSIDVSPSVFQDLASLDIGRAKINWSLVTS
ncbi:RlpA-like double-psi beta-barrel-protein domain-containing protein-containing protein [Hypoxylon cercidicola]|nr:RlpA-like double-psi beta-barrel-protein domain-containing protein-containing protein [Hypoxylon cercidicola]